MADKPVWPYPKLPTLERWREIAREFGAPPSTVRKLQADMQRVPTNPHIRASFEAMRRLGQRLQEKRERELEQEIELAQRLTERKRPVQPDDEDKYVYVRGRKPEIKGDITEGRRLVRGWKREQPDITDDQLRWRLQDEAGITGSKSAIRRMIIVHVSPPKKRRS